MRSSKAQIGLALDQLTSDVKDTVLDLVADARTKPEPYKTALMKQAVDSPHRARAQLEAWIADYEARNGTGSAAAFLQQCLVAAGSAKSLAQINTAVANLETGAQAYVTQRNGGATWEQIATSIEAQIERDPSEAFDYTRLPIPVGYLTVWNEPW